MDSSVVGNISFAKRDDETIPIHHLRLEFWSRGWWGKWRKLSQGFTAEDGSFSLPFDLRMARRFRNYSLHFEIYQITHVFYKDKYNVPAYKLFKSIEIDQSDLIGMQYNLQEYLPVLLGVSN